MLYFRHDLDLVDKQLVVLTPDPFLVNDFDCIVLVRISEEVPVVYRSILALAEELWRQHDLNFVSGKSDHFAARF